jgi:hypothetical protein
MKTVKGGTLDERDPTSSIIDVEIAKFLMNQDPYLTSPERVYSTVSWPTIVYLFSHGSRGWYFYTASLTHPEPPRNLLNLLDSYTLLREC